MKTEMAHDEIVVV